MKTKWAVACAVPIFGVLFALGNGCSATQSQVKEFQRMDVGEGPGDVLTHLIGLQKESGDQSVMAHPPPAAQGEGSGVPPIPSEYPADVSAGGLSMSRDTGTMHDVMPAVPPLGKPPLLVQTDVENAESPPGDSVHAEIVPTRSPSTPATIQQTSPKAVATVKSPDFREDGNTSPPVMDHQMILKKDATSQTVTRKPFSPIPSPPSSNIRKKDGESADYLGGPNYRIGFEDVLHVDVWGNAELTGDVTVRPDGKISMPLIQDIQAEGLTAAALSANIRQKLFAFLRDPTVSVTVKQVNSYKFFIIGYVAKPGTYPLKGDITVLQAISIGGGFTQWASPKKIRLVRTANGKQDVREINYYDIIEKGGEGNYLLKPGDTLVVP